MADNVEFRDQFTRAGEERADLFADQIIRIADDGSLDTTTRQDKNGNDYEQVNSDHINRSRLMVDARFRLMAILAPKKYSEKVATRSAAPMAARSRSKRPCPTGATTRSPGAWRW